MSAWLFGGKEHPYSQTQGDRLPHNDGSSAHAELHMVACRAGIPRHDTPQHKNGHRAISGRTAGRTRCQKHGKAGSAFRDGHRCTALSQAPCKEDALQDDSVTDKDGRNPEQPDKACHKEEAECRKQLEDPTAARHKRRRAAHES